MLASFPDPLHAVVIGATGGLGAALVEALLAHPGVGHLSALSRRPGPGSGSRLRTGFLDLLDETSIAAAAQAAAAGPPPRLILLATGLLHDAAMAPEKNWAALSAEPLARGFAVNSIGPALVAKHWLPLLPRQGKAVFAAFSARVGSIGDNRLGGWYGYRASKAALNMLLRTLAIELARRRPEAICLGLHPGTVETGLSAPFLGKGVVGMEPSASAARLLAVIDRATLADSGRVLAWDGTTVPP